MIRRGSLGLVSAVLTMSFAAAPVLAGQVPQFATSAAKASPELVGALSKELKSTPEQAAGAAGALFSLAKTQLKPEDFSKVSAAVPGMDLLLKAAPALGGGGGAAGALSALAGSAGGLTGVASAFSKLGLKPEMVALAVPVVVSAVQKVGGPTLGNLLASVLK